MKWIKTRGKMPPMDEEVLVWWYPAGEQGGSATLSEFNEEGWEMGSAQYFRVTHWMRIEEPRDE